MNAHTNDGRLLEGAARVVAIEGPVAWLEPEPASGCSGCASATTCGAAAFGRAGFGSSARRLRARRFVLDIPPAAAPLAIGDRVAVGLADDALVVGALAAYGLPLAVVLTAAAVVDATFSSDAATAIAMAAALVPGLGAARALAHRLAAGERGAARFLRRLGDDAGSTAA